MLNQFNLISFVKVGLIGAVISMTGVAHADQNKFSCSGVGGADEWTIYVDLEKKLAGFFDNDSTAVVPLKSVRRLRTFPPRVLYVFEGDDSHGPNDGTLRITFNETNHSAYVTFQAGSSEERTLHSSDGCTADENIDLSL